MGCFFGEVSYGNAPFGFESIEQEENEEKLERYISCEDTSVYAVITKDKLKRQVSDGIYLNKSKDILLICIGYLYNHEVLESDILLLYEERGMEWVKHINGQFSFILCDFKKKEIYLCVDRTGTYNLYYAFTEEGLVFATDMKYILTHPAVEKKLNFKALQQMLLFCSIASPETIVKSIKSVPGGTYIKVAGKSSKDVVYWDLIFPEKDYIADKVLTDKDYMEKFEEVLTNSIKNKADIGSTLGVLISGGLDSSVVGLWLQRLYRESKLFTFSLDYKFSGLSESMYQNMMVEALVSKHMVRDFGLDEFSKLLPEAVNGAEGPFCELGTCAYFLLYQLAASQKCDLFSGLGVDELFAGYITYKADRFRKINVDLSETDRKINYQLWGDEKFSYESTSYGADMVWMELLFTQDGFDEILKNNCLSEPMFNSYAIERDLDTINRRSYIDFKLRLMNHKNYQIATKMSRRHGLRTHYPFLDNSMIEYVCQVPYNIRLRGNTDKYIIREWAKRLVPSPILNRKKISLADFSYVEVIDRLLADYEDYFSYDYIQANNLVSYDYLSEVIGQLHKTKSALDRFREKNIILTYLTLCIFMNSHKIEIY